MNGEAALALSQVFSLFVGVVANYAKEGIDTFLGRTKPSKADLRDLEKRINSAKSVSDLVESVVAHVGKILSREGWLDDGTKALLNDPLFGDSLFTWLKTTPETSEYTKAQRAIVHTIRTNFRKHGRDYSEADGDSWFAAIEQAIASNETLAHLRLQTRVDFIAKLAIATDSKVDQVLTQTAPITEMSAKLERIGEAVLPEFRPKHEVVGLISSAIELAQRKIDEFNYAEALTKLTQIQTDHWTQTSVDQRHKVLVLESTVLRALGKVRDAGLALRRIESAGCQGPEALADVAFGWYLTGDPKEALTKANEVLAQTPNVPLAWTVRFLCEETDKSVGDLLVRVPASLRRNGRILNTLALKAGYRRHFDEAADYAEQALNGDPPFWPAQLTLSRIELCRVVEAKHESDRRRFAASAETHFTRALEEALRRKDLPAKAGAYLGRSQARRALKDDVGSAQDFALASSLAPDDPNILFEQAVRLDVKGFTDGARVHYERVYNQSDNEQRPQIGLALGKLLKQSNEASDRDRADDLLSESLKSTYAEEEVKAAALEALVVGLVHEDKGIEAEKFLDSQDAQHAPLMTRLRLHATVALRLDKPEDAVSYLETALREAGDGSHPIEMRAIAHLLVDLKKYEQSFDALKRAIKPGTADPDLALYLSLAQKLGRTGDIHDACSALREAGVYDFAALRLEVSTWYRTAPLKALSVAEAARDQFSSRWQVYLLWCSTKAALEQLKPDEVDLSRLPSQEAALEDPQVAGSVVEILRQIGKVDEALDLAYELTRHHPDSELAGHVYLRTTLLDRREDRFVRYEAVSIGAAFQLKPDNDPERWFVIVGGKPPKPTFNEIADDHPLTKLVIGKKVGDRVPFKSGLAQYTPARITSVVDRRLFRMKSLLRTFEVDHPSQSFLQSFKALKKDAAGKEVVDLDALSAMFEKNAERVAPAVEQFGAGKFPASALAPLLQRTTFRLHRDLADNLHGRIPCITSEAKNVGEALANIDISSGVILDETALASLVNLELLQLLSIDGIKWIVTAHTLQAVEKELKNVVGEGFVSLRGGSPQIVKTKTDIEADKSKMLELVEQVRVSCHVVSDPSVFDGLDERDTDALEVLGPAAFESTVLALNRGIPLCTDDAFVGSYFRDAKKGKRLWTVGLADLLRQQGKIEGDAVLGAKARYLGCGYWGAEFGNGEFGKLCELAGWDTGHRLLLKGMMHFANPVLTGRTLSIPLCFCIKDVLGSSSLVGKQDMVIDELLRFALQREDGKDLILAVEQQIEAVLGQFANPAWLAAAKGRIADALRHAGEHRPLILPLPGIRW